jgi:hypothetical protein
LFRERLRQVQAAAEWVADELEANASQIRAPRYRKDFAPIQEDLRSDAWRQHGPILHALAKPHPELWDEVRRLYAECERPGHDPPSAERFEETAARLRETMRAVRF